MRRINRLIWPLADPSWPNAWCWPVMMALAWGLSVLFWFLLPAYISIIVSAIGGALIGWTFATDRHAAFAKLLAGHGNVGQRVAASLAAVLREIAVIIEDS